MQGITIREGTLADIPIIAHHRRRMCEDMNYSDVDALSTMVTVTAEYLKKAIAEGSFRSWLACDDGKVVAGGAVVISPVAGACLRSRMPPSHHPERLHRA